MTRTKKALIVALSVLCVVCLALFTLSACKKKGNDEEVVTLSKIQITKAPTTVTYIAGETFDPAGMEVTATFTDATTKILESTEWTYTAPEMTVPSGEFQAVKTVKVSYTYGEGENEVTKTANQSITITKKVISAEIVTYPETLEYFAGQFFDPTGLTIDVKFEDNTTASDVAITRENAEFDPAEGIPSGTEKVKVTYGGYSFNIAIDLKEGVWIEGETGLYNGEYVEQKTTTDGGQLGIDASLEDAQTYALRAYVAQVKADYALTQLRLDEDFDEETLAATPSKNYDKANWDGVTVNGEQLTALYDAVVAWINANSEELDEYLEAEGYLTDGEYEGAKIDEYVESEEYAEAVAHYRANNDTYLGGVQQGSVVSFVFSSDGEGSGSIAFRLASAYLCLDNGNWGPVIMGDIQLNKLAEVYVNGIKYDIPDTAVLYGGMAPDGAYSARLWVNWQEVQLDDIAFAEGRNVIELKILEHKIVAPAQPSYSWSCNVDSMLILPDETAGCTLATFDNSVDITTEVTSVTLEKVEDSAVITVTGTYDFKGYVEDIIDVTIGGIAAELVTDNGVFTATLDVTDFDLDSYDIIVNEVEAVKGDDVTVSEATVTIGYNDYSIAVDEDDNTITLKVDSDYKVIIEKINIADSNTTITFKEEDGHVYLVIGGSSYEATIENYDLEDEDDAELVKTLLETKIKAGTYFDLQSLVPTGEWNGNYETQLANVHKVVVDMENNTFEVVADITEYDFTKGYGMIHYALADAESKDWKPAIEADTLTSKLDLVGGRYNYSLKWEKDGGNALKYWGLICVAIEDTKAPTLTVSGIELSVSDGKPVLVITGSVANKQANNVSAFYLATVLNGGNWATVNRASEIAKSTVWDEADQNDTATFTVTWDLSTAENVAVGSNYYLHFSISGVTGVDLPSSPINEEKTEITVNGVKYSLKSNGGASSPLIYFETITEEAE